MGELGKVLRKAREEGGLSLTQGEEATKIRSAYLQALEQENYDLLPPPVYVKAFLKSYAVYLGLDPQQVLSLYEQPEATTRTTPAPTILDEPLQPLTLRRWWPVGVILLVIATAAAGWWGYERYYGTVPFARATATPTPTLVQPSPMPLSPTPQPPTATPLPTHTASPTPTATPTSVPLELRIEIVAHSTWLRVQVDGETTFMGTLQPGTVRTWKATERIVMRCGNAGATRVTLNGQPLGFVGELGQVIDKEWTAPGVPTRTPES